MGMLKLRTPPLGLDLRFVILTQLPLFNMAALRNPKTRSGCAFHDTLHTSAHADCFGLRASIVAHTSSRAVLLWA